MSEIVLPAYAKLNITLDVLNRRNDGYHTMKMLMQTVAFHDVVRVRTDMDKGMEVRTSLRFLPTDQKNLAALAAVCFAQETETSTEGLRIDIVKRIPVGAGLGGGSADAAAVLRALRDLHAPTMTNRQLAKIGERVGSDVPYCVMGGTMLAEGRGEVLTALPPFPKCHVVICKPDFSISTAALFSQMDVKKLNRRPDIGGAVVSLGERDLLGVARRMYNVFEDVLPIRYNEVKRIHAKLIELGALGACMSGTGSAVFGLFDDKALAFMAFKTLRSLYRDTFLTEIQN